MDHNSLHAQTRKKNKAWILNKFLEVALLLTIIVIITELKEFFSFRNNSKWNILALAGVSNFVFNIDH